MENRHKKKNTHPAGDYFVQSKGSRRWEGGLEIRNEGHSLMQERVGRFSGCPGPHRTMRRKYVGREQNRVVCREIPTGKKKKKGKKIVGGMRQEGTILTPSSYSWV